MSEDSSSKPSQAPIRIRSRFPRAQPNIAVSTGLARIRKISGHFPDTKESENHVPEPPPSPQTTRQLVDSVLSPKPSTHDEDVSKSPVKKPDESNSPSLTFRQLINNQSAPSPSHHIHSVSQPGTPIILTTTLQNGSVPVAAFLNNAQAYNPKFSKEHIMNIIKYKAIQKLKKIESENLKEKRKKNKKILSKNVQEQSNLSTDDVLASKIDKSKLRMRDFLYFNPRVSKKSESGEAIPDATNEQIIGSINRSSSSLTLNSENDTNDTPESVSSKSSSVYSAVKPVVSLAPQLRINDDGTIEINEESLVIQREHQEPVYESTIVENEQGDNLTYNSYRKFHHTKKWTERETAKFYKALSMVGTDFTMIQKFFSHRNRDEIKRKFKREEKINQALIDKILSKTVTIDLSFFVSSSGEDEEQKDEQKKKKVKTKKNDDDDDTKSITSTNNDNETKKKNKLKRVQKRAFVDSESDNESNSRQKLSDSNQNSILIEEEDHLKVESQAKIVIQDEEKQPIEKLPPCSSLFEASQDTFEIINDQIITKKVDKKSDSSDSGSEIELVFDMDKQEIDEKRNNKKNEQEKINNPLLESDDDDDGEIILDLDNNTIIRNSQLGTSSITITKQSHKQ